MKDNTNKGYLSAQGYFGLSRYTNNFNNQQTSNQSLGNNPVNSQDTSKVMAQGRVQNEGFDFAHFLVQEKKRWNPNFCLKTRKVTSKAYIHLMAEEENLSRPSPYVLSYHGQQS